VKLPFSDRTVTSRPGWRRHPVTGQRSYHAGTDLAVPERTPIFLRYPGEVVRRDHKPDVGHRLTVRLFDDAGRKVIVKLNHLVEPSRLRVREAFGPGECVAYSGKTGAGALGPHLCLEVWVDGRVVDPREVEL